MQRLTDADVIRAIVRAPGTGTSGEIPVDFPATLDVAFPTSIKFKYIKDAGAAYAVLECDLWAEPIVFRLAVYKQPASKPETRTEAGKLMDAYIASGRDIRVFDQKERGLNYSHADWKRKQQGLKVATKEEIDAERSRRMLIAIKNRDNDTAIKLAQKGFDKEIKFDIENGRLGPNGEIR